MIVIIKPTNDCNARCVYCQARGGDHSPSIMAPHVLQKVIHEITNYAGQHPEQPHLWIWHGGEPLLAGASFFRMVKEFQSRSEAENNTVSKNLIQTNLTLLTDELAHVIREVCGISGVGTSFDIDPEIRPHEDGSPPDELWWRGVNILRQKGMTFGLSYVVHKGSLGREKELYDFFKSLAPRLFVRCNPLLNMGRGADDEAIHHRIDADSYGQFLIRMAELWEEDRRVLQLQPLLEWVGRWEGWARTLCCDSGGRCHLTHLGIGPDGEVSNCGRCHDVSQLRYGNLAQQSFREILAERAESPLRNRATQLLNSSCGACRLWDTCHGGCPADAYAHRGSVLARTGWCKSRRLLADFYRHRGVTQVSVHVPAELWGASAETSTFSHNPTQSGNCIVDLSVPYRFHRDLEEALALEHYHFRLQYRLSSETDVSRAVRSLGQSRSFPKTLFLEDPSLLFGMSVIPTPLIVNWLPGSPLSTELFQFLRKVRGAPLRFVVSGWSDDVYDATLVFSSLGFAVEISLGSAVEMRSDDMIRILDYALHTPQLAVPIQPHHQLFTYFIEQRDKTLWQIMGEDPRYGLFITDDGRIAASRRAATRGHVLGSLSEGIASGKKRRVEKQCNRCEFRQVCDGYFQPHDSESATVVEEWDCSRPVAFLQEIQEAATVFLAQMKAPPRRGLRALTGGDDIARKSL